MAFPRPSSPANAWRDLRAFLDQQGRYKILFAMFALAMPSLIVLGFYVDSQPDRPKPQIIYVENWPESRSDAQIKADQKVDQARRDAFKAERRRQFQRLEKQLGI
jgi:hypothetical protein